MSIELTKTDNTIPVDDIKIIESTISADKVVEKVEEVADKIADKVIEVAKLEIAKVIEVTKVEVAELEPVINENINKILLLLLDDPEFVNKIETSIKNILADNKVDYTDIPEFVFLIMDAYNSIGKVKLTEEEIPEFVKCVFNYIVDKYKLLTQDNRKKYEIMILSSVKLALMVPKLLKASCFAGICKKFF